MNIRQIREEDCKHFKFRDAYNKIKGSNIPALVTDNYIVLSSDRFLSVAVESIDPLEMSEANKMILQTQFTMACQEFQSIYHSVMLIPKKED